MVYPMQGMTAGESHGTTRSQGGRHRAHRTDEASVMPAEPQCLQEPVPSINLEVAATALGTKHLLVVCKKRQSTGQHSPALQPLVSGELGCSIAKIPQGQPEDNSLPAPGGQCPRHLDEMPVPWLPWVPCGCHQAAGMRQTSSPRMQHLPLMYTLHHHHGNTGMMALPSSQRGPGWRALGYRRGVPAFPMAWEESHSTGPLVPHSHGHMLNPNSSWCPQGHAGWHMGLSGPTSLTVGLSLLHIEGTVADGSFAGSTGEALHVPGHLQRMHHLLEGNCCQPGAGLPWTMGNSLLPGQKGARDPWGLE